MARYVHANANDERFWGLLSLIGGLVFWLMKRDPGEIPLGKDED